MPTGKVDGEDAERQLDWNHWMANSRTSLAGGGVATPLESYPANVFKPSFALFSREKMRKEEVIKKIGAKNWKAFEKFMAGQTVGVYPDGSADIYECDVENFLHKKKTGKALFFD